MMTPSIMTLCRKCLVIAALTSVLTTMLPVCARTFRVDDSGTVVNRSVSPMQWKQLVPGRRGTDHSVEAEVNVALRLDLRNWVNQSVQIYMALAPTEGDPVFATWRTWGALLPGTTQSGRRAVIFNGLVKTAVLEETIELTMKTDGRTLTSPRSLQFYFEIDAP
jgi:hypothetical protein